MTRTFTRLILTILAGTLLQLHTGDLLAANPAPRSPDYARLLDYIAIQDLQGPLVAFGEDEEEFDRQRNRENIDFLNHHKELLENIQSRLQNESLNWRLGASFKRLLVVPENRQGYARLFEQYCRESIDYLLARVHMPNPYSAITTFHGTLPQPRQGTDGGVTAYLVHNIANEYIEEYLFFKQADDPRKVRIKLSNREFDSKIGSYTSKLKIGENSQYKFIRESYTLWQNSADIPFNVFIVPIEETLHILLRPSTEAAMQSELEDIEPTRLEQVQAVINQWMAVEEAIVGGVVHQVMPDLMSHFIGKRAEDLLADAMDARNAHTQYRLLDNGIHLVQAMGEEASLTLYRQDPEKFRNLMTQGSLPVASVEKSTVSFPMN